MISLETDGIFADGLADTVVYYNGTTSASISAVVDRWYDGNKPGDQATILVKKSDVPVPEYRHTFTIDGDTWYVRPATRDADFVIGQDDTSFLIAISKTERFKQWRP